MGANTIQKKENASVSNIIIDTVPVATGGQNALILQYPQMLADQCLPCVSRNRNDLRDGSGLTGTIQKVQNPQPNRMGGIANNVGCPRQYVHFDEWRSYIIRHFHKRFRCAIRAFSA